MQTVNIHEAKTHLSRLGNRGTAPLFPGGAPLLPFDQIVNATRASFAVAAARLGISVKIGNDEIMV